MRGRAKRRSLSGLLNSVDPALIRRGRMDVHIELGYCGFEAFKVLAKNYLGSGGAPVVVREGEHLTGGGCRVADAQKSTRRGQGKPVSEGFGSNTGKDKRKGRGRRKGEEGEASEAVGRALEAAYLILLLFLGPLVHGFCDVSEELLCWSIKMSHDTYCFVLELCVMDGGFPMTRREKKIK